MQMHEQWMKYVHQVSDAYGLPVHDASTCRADGTALKAGTFPAREFWLGVKVAANRRA